MISICTAQRPTREVSETSPLRVSETTVVKTVHETTLGTSEEELDDPMT